MYLRWFARGGECESERAFVSKTHTRAWEKTVTHEREFWVSGKRNRCIPRPRGVSRAAALVSSRTERSRTLPAFAFAGRKTTLTTTSSSRYRGCFDPFVFGRKKVGKRLVSSRVAKRAGWRSLRSTTTPRGSERRLSLSRDDDVVVVRGGRRVPE